MQIIYTPGFYRGYKKLPDEIKLRAESKEKIFRKDPFSSVLKTHKLHGQFKEFWSFSINSKYRVIFEFGGKNEVYFHSVGDHGVYD
jgi:mRNA-degrading endonuclease YafQ of YafQ-DinJ toxin-antitoxin module